MPCWAGSVGLESAVVRAVQSHPLTGDQVADGCHLRNRAQTRTPDHLWAGTGPGRRGWNPGASAGFRPSRRLGSDWRRCPVLDWNRASPGLELDPICVRTRCSRPQLPVHQWEDGILPPLCCMHTAWPEFSVSLLSSPPFLRRALLEFLVSTSEEVGVHL